MEERGLWKIRTAGETPEIAGKTWAQALVTVEFLAVQTLLDHPQCPLSFHSALVAKKNKNIMILGPNEAGKSTLACALWQQGWSLVGDDVTFVNGEAGSACSAPRRVSLRRPSRALLGEDLWRQIQATPSYHQTTEGCVFHPYEVDGQKVVGASQLAGIIFLARRGVMLEPAQWQRLDPARALLALLPYSNVVRTRDPGEALCRIQPLAATVPAYDLGRGPLPDMIGVVEHLLQGAL